MDIILLIISLTLLAVSSLLITVLLTPRNRDGSSLSVPLPVRIAIAIG